MNLSAINGYEIHFSLSDKSHSVDSLILNRSNAELLKLIYDLSKRLDIQLKIETEALREGGLRQIWKLIGKNSGQISILLMIVSLFLAIKPPQDKELLELQKQNLLLSNEKIRLQIDELERKVEIQEKVDENNNVESIIGHDLINELKSTQIINTLNFDVKSVFYRSNFYKNIIQEEKIDKLETILLHDQIQITDKIEVESNDFVYFIREKERTDDNVDENAEIIIIAPVLENLKHKWLGYYKNELINFYLNDKEFNDSIESGEVSFAHGDKITCILIIKKKINELGEEIISSYSVSEVLKVETGDQIIETYKNKIRKKMIKEHKSQQELKFEDET